MTTLTIPKALIREEELIVIPKKEYENLLRTRAQRIQEVTMNSIQKRALDASRKNLSKGKFLTIHELRHKLGIAR